MSDHRHTDDVATAESVRPDDGQDPVDRLFLRAYDQLMTGNANGGLPLDDWLHTFAALERVLVPLFDADGLLPVLLSPAPLSDDSPGLYRMFANDGLGRGSFETVHILGRCPILDAAMEAGVPTRYDEPGATLRPEDRTPFEDVLARWNVRSALIVPVCADVAKRPLRDVAGALVLYHTEPHRFGDLHIRLATRLMPLLVTIFNSVHLCHEHHLRSLHTEIIHEVSAEAIAQLPSADQLFQRVVELIYERFQFYDVAVFRVEWGVQELELVAHAGDYRHYLDLNYRQGVNTGILGHVARTGSTYLANDVASDPIYINAFPEEHSVRSELAVPIKLEGEFVVAVLEIQSQTLGAFDHYDVDSLEILCQLMARILQSADSYDQMRQLKEFNSQVLDTMPSAVVVLDDTFHVMYANEQFCELQGTDLMSILYHPVDAICSAFLMEAEGLRALLEQLDSVQGCGFLSEVRMEESRRSRIVDIRICKTWDQPTRYILILQDVSVRVNQLEQMRMLQALGQELQRTLDLDSLLRAILTCVTAGPGFGFNRAMIFLLDDEELVLQERLHVGPSSQEEAYRIWGQIGFKKLEEYLQDIRSEEESGSSVQLARRYVRVPVTQEELDEMSRWSGPFILRRGDTRRSRIENTFRHLSDAEEAVVIPLIARDRPIGVILADNLFTNRPVTDQTLQTLAAFASQAALAVSNAATYRKLEAAFEELTVARSKLLENEKLAIIGQMAAHVAHEIRNPLVSIGGFARRIVKTCNDEEVRHRAEIIVREASRLEIILKDVMDFASPFSFHYEAVSLEACVREMVDVLGEAAEDSGVEIRVEAAENLPLVRADAERLKQVILNLAKNALEAMPHGGCLTFHLWSEEDDVGLSIHDTGIGISEEGLRHLFDPFFTTKQHGSGLGLAVTKRIVEQHGGAIAAHSVVNEGTTFTIRLPKYV